MKVFDSASGNIVDKYEAVATWDEASWLLVLKSWSMETLVGLRDYQVSEENYEGAALVKKAIDLKLKEDEENKRNSTG